MALKIQSFEFGEFVFDIQEKVLRKDQKPVPITPKAFLLLQTLIENHGRLVEKEKLIKTVWPDSIVEEGNLSFTVTLLRKALGDSKNEPRFIETVPKRGYRFIADVSEIPSHEATTETPSSIPRTKAVSPTFTAHSRVFFILGFCLLVLIASLGFASWYLSRGALQPQALILKADLNIEKLTTDGAARHVVLSSDGSKTAYVNISRGSQSVWVRDLESSNSIEIVPPSEFFYGGLAISSDNRTLFFTRGPYLSGTYHFDLYRVPIFGGIPTKLVSKTEGWIDVSPDDQKLSFVRCDYRDNEFCSLWLADVDGKDERILASRPRPFRISVNAISPDGKSVAFAVGQSRNQSNEFELVEIDIETGQERQITRERFFNINGLAWLPDRVGFLITASRIPIKHFQIWRVEAGSGIVQPLTRDSETYSGVSLDAEAKILVATQVKGDFKLNLLDLEDPSTPPQILADGSTTDFSPDGKVVFSSRQTGNDEIWKINTDGSSQTQLTNDPADDSGPVVSSDGQIFFASNRSGEVHVWRMNNDGSSQTQITSTEGGFPRFISNDGWVYYHAGRDRSLRRVPVDGGSDELILMRKIEQIAFSPDGSRAALFVPSENRNTLYVVSIPEGLEIIQFKLAEQNAGLAALDWTPDGNNLAYIQTSPGIQENPLWVQPLIPERSLRQFRLDGSQMENNGLSLSPDGKQFVLCRGDWKHDAVLFTGLK
jgi:DNA-binding winged helix-turn-helix (wHTH) protein/Tol biopolymer transport system component